MPRRKDGGPPRDTVPVKMDRELHRILRIVAAEENKEIFEIHDAIVRPAIHAWYKKIVAKRKGAPEA